jgi:aspartokinase-like uncharacterized kinase
MVVIKVGGSLLDFPPLPARILAYLQSLSERDVILVAGAGRFGDVLRTFDTVHRLGEERSHRLALHALDLTARVLSTLVPGSAVVGRPDEVSRAWERGALPVLAPRAFMETTDPFGPAPLPKTWETTSDSIAARVAHYLEADELVLLKSTLPPGPLSRSRAAREGFVDPNFPAASARLECVKVVNLRDDPITEILLNRA